MNPPAKPSRGIRVFLGIGIGLLLHMVVIGVGVFAGMVLSGARGGVGEGLFWGFLLALLFSPGGMFVGGMTGWVASSGTHSWLSTTLIGSIPAVLAGLAAWAFFAVVSRSGNLSIPGLVFLAGVLIAAFVAKVAQAPQASRA